MSKDITPEQQPGTQGQPVIEDNPPTDTRTVDELREALAKAEALTKSAGEEAKKHRQTVQAIKAEKEAAEKAKLEAEGKWQELAEQARKEAQEKGEILQKTHAKFAFSQIKSALEVEAAKLGCVNTTDLVKLVDLSDVEVDENFMPNKEKLKAKVEQQAKERSYLFAKQAPGVRDAAPASGKPVPSDFATELRAAKTQKEYDAVMRKHGKI